MERVASPRSTPTTCRTSSACSRGGNVPFNWEWVGRTPYLFPLQNMVLWGMGLPLGIAAWGGFLWAAWRLLRRREATNLLLLAWIAFYFLFWGRQFNQTMRYFLPIYPSLVLLAAYALNELWQLRPQRRRSMTSCAAGPRGLGRSVPVLLRATVVGVAVSTVLWALAFTNIYRHPLSRVAGVSVDDRQPAGEVSPSPTKRGTMPCPSACRGSGRTSIPLTSSRTAPTCPTPRRPCSTAINQADYIVLSSNRLYASIPRAPAKWPMTSNFYELLLEEKLRASAWSRRSPPIRRSSALRSTTTPPRGTSLSTTIRRCCCSRRRRTTRRSSSWRRWATPACRSAASQLAPANAAQNALLLRPDDCQTQREGGTWTSIFDPGEPQQPLPASHLAPGDRGHVPGAAAARPAASSAPCPTEATCCSSRWACSSSRGWSGWGRA